LAKDCWWKDDAAYKKKKEEAAKAQGKPSGKGKPGGKPGKGKGGANSLEEHVEEPEAEKAWGAGGFDLCEFSQDCGEIVDGGWLRVNFDTGTAKTVFPMKATYGKGGGVPGGLQFKTATGEVVDDGGSFYVGGKDEYEQDVGLNGHLAPVHKPLAAGSQMTGKGHDVWLSKDYSCILRNGSPVHKEVHEAAERILAKHVYGMTTLYEERGVYNFYVKQKDGKVVNDVCAGETYPRRPVHP
jgi:hypothetical protein